VLKLTQALYILKRAQINKWNNFMAKAITIYTTSTCAYCVMVKKWLGMKGLGYQEVNLEQHPERRGELLALSGQMAVPVTVVTDDVSNIKDVTIGWNPSKLGAAVATMQPARVA
jgi:glutaredoxin 3